MLSGRINGELANERVCLLMRILSCSEMNLECEESEGIIETLLKEKFLRVYADFHQQSTTLKKEEQHHSVMH